MSEPGVFLVGGSDLHRRRLFLRRLLAARQREGWTVQWLTGADGAALAEVIGTAGVLFDNRTMAVVESPAKLPLALVRDQLLDPNPSVVVVLVVDSDKAEGPVAEAVPEAARKFFPLPPYYKLDDAAALYAVEVARGMGMPLEADLARALVGRVGNDGGVVYYEVHKACALARATGANALTAAVLRGSLASLNESDGSGVVAALAERNVVRVATELNRYWTARRSDPTVELCGRVLSPAVLKWLQAAHLQRLGMSPAGAAGRMGANPWYWEHKVLPAARAWGVGGCARLLRVIAAGQLAVFSGGLSPWVRFNAQLLALMTHLSGGR